ncbi:non-ribosomal peptide synthetase [Arenibacter latericius]|uniref:non-ribosomal peptide synthetase n=1 Tax=Arenibacter latericius TaxID=86104 RepID=UPI0004205E1C|nr:amino acid adenylation domain-containing protein [Arenibacter latericius]
MSILSRWKNREKDNTEQKTITKAPVNVSIPLSRGQQRLWFLEQLYPKNPVYNYAEIHIFKGALNKENLLKSLQLVFHHNDILRCSFHFKNGDTVQEIDLEPELKVAEFDLSHLSSQELDLQKNEILFSDATKPFNMQKAPLMRASLIKVGELEHILLVTMHHIITDKWSMGIFREQLAKYYIQLGLGSTVILEKNKIQYTDFAYWQQEIGVNTSQVDYWLDKLSGEIPLLDIPVDFVVPKEYSFKGGTLTQDLSKNLSQQILDLSKKLETTPYIFLLSVYYVLLYRYSGQSDIIVGTPMTNRNEKVLEEVIGFFDETIALRTELSHEMSFLDLVKIVRKTTLEAFSNKDAPFDLLVKELKPQRSLSSNPFFSTMFIYHAVPELPSFGPDIALEYSYFDFGVSKFDLTLYVSYENGLLSPSFEYATDLYDEVTIKRFQEHYKLLLEGIILNPEMAISKIQMMTQEENEFFFPLKDTVEGPYSKYNGIHDIISEVGNENPEICALAFGDKSMSYGELMAKSEVIAARILKETRGRNEIVGLCVNRSMEMIVGMLAILKAGCAYLPIDSEYPKERISFILNDSDVKTVLIQTQLNNLFDGFDIELIDLNDLKVPTVGADKKFPHVERDALAYIIYTSGSTGNPKGVPITHGNIINSTEGRLLYYKDKAPVFLLFSSISFDSSKAGIFWTLCTGGTLVISQKHLEQDMDLVSNIVLEHNISHTLMLPSLYKMVLDYGNLNKLKSLSCVIVAGEACPSSLGNLHFKKIPQVKLYNEYGPTEATVWCIAHQILEQDLQQSIPLGRPVAKAEIYLLDKYLRPVPFGATGEIYVGGPGLAGYYINNSALTSAAYVDNPFKKGSQNKLYRTGDLGRYRVDGAIEFLGRTDHQIKIRGYRIDLDGIEHVANESPMVERAIIVAEKTGHKAGSIAIDSDYTAEIMAYFESPTHRQKVIDVVNAVASLKAEEKEYLLRQL